MRWRPTPGSAAALLLLLALMCGGLGFGAATVLASTYTAQSTVLVTPLQGNPFNPSGNGDDLNNMQSEAQLAQSDAVANLVPASGPDAAARLSVAVPPNTQLLEFTYEATDQEAARAGAQGFASAYLEFRTSRADQAVVAQARAIQEQINAQSDRINDLAGQKRDVSSAEQRAALQQQMNGIASQVVQLSTTLSAVTTLDRDPGQIVTRGHTVGRSPQSSRILFSLAGAILGCGIGGVLLFVAARRRNAGSPGVDELPAGGRRPSHTDPVDEPSHPDVAAEPIQTDSADEPTRTDPADEPTDADLRFGTRELVGRGNAE